MVLAAGKGSRLEPLSGAVPKPLMPLGGRSLLEWNLTWVAEAGLRRVWINVHHGGGAIEAALG
ncbi:MAG: NTP transferase domain-containing protein, partial [Gemmatimonadetes bacterium]|nr:NTP transferase domain-containing protein [Gemmatimonadota bacterium]